MVENCGLLALRSGPTNTDHAAPGLDRAPPSAGSTSARTAGRRRRPQPAGSESDRPASGGRCRSASDDHEHGTARRRHESSRSTAPPPAGCRRRQPGVGERHQRAGGRSTGDEPQPASPGGPAAGGGRAPARRDLAEVCTLARPDVAGRPGQLRACPVGATNRRPRSAAPAAVNVWRRRRRPRGRCPRTATITTGTRS